MENKDTLLIFLIVCGLFLLGGLSQVYGTANVINVTLLYPANNTWNRSMGSAYGAGYVAFLFKCTGNQTMYNATLYLDNKANKSYGNLTGQIYNNTEINISVFGVADTTNGNLGLGHNWTVQCCNSTGSICIEGGVGWGGVGGVTTSNASVKIDATDPVITLNAPGNNTWNRTFTNGTFNYGNGSVYFDFTVTETNLANCSLFLAGAKNKTNTSSVVSGTAKQWIFTRIADIASLDWTFKCRELSNYEKAAAGFVIKIDTTNPTGEIIMPRTTTINTQNPIKISCSGSDATSGVHTVKLKITKPSGVVLEYDLENDIEKTIQGIDTGEAGKYLVDCIVYDSSYNGGTDTGNTYTTEQMTFNTYSHTVKSTPTEVTPEEEVTPGEEVAEGAPTEGAPTEGGEAPSKAWIWVLVIVVIVLVLYFVLKKKR